MAYFATGAALTAALNKIPAGIIGSYEPFNPFYYAQTYMSAYAGTLTPIEHFVQVGSARGYQPNADFNPTYYQSRFSDLKGLDSADLLYHYVNFGLNEGRPGNATLAAVDWEAYLTAYPDVATYVNANLSSFGGSTTNGAIAHYVKFGVAQSFTLPVTPVAATAKTYPLTTGVDNGTSFVGGASDDVFNASDISSSTTWTVGDVLDGGAGNDSLYVTRTAAITQPAGATVSNIETAYLTSGAEVTASTASWTGLTKLNTTSVGATTITAATTTAVTATETSQAATAISVDGGLSVTVSAADSTTGTIAVGATTAAAGAVSVTRTGDYSSSAVADVTLGAITVKGGTAVTVVQTTGITAAETAAALTDTSNYTMIMGAVTVTGNASTTSVSVTGPKAVTKAETGTAGKIGITKGAVTITDLNAASASVAGTISSVSLSGYGNSSIDSSALTSVTLAGTGGTLGIGRGALTAVPTANTLAINLNSATSLGVITDSEATSNYGFTTINVVNSGTENVVADLIAVDATTLNVSGTGQVTFTLADVLANAPLLTAVNVTNTGTTIFTGDILLSTATFTGGAGAESVILGVSTKATTMGAGDDTVTITSLGTAATVNAGDGTADVLKMTGSDAATASATTTFAAQISNFERLSLTGFNGNTVDLGNLDDISYVTIAGTIASGALNNLASGGTIINDEGGTAYTVAVKNATTGTADVLNLSTTAPTAIDS